MSIDTAGGAQTELAHAGSLGSIVWSPDGRRIAYAAGGTGSSAALHVIQAGGGGDTVLASLAGVTEPIVWSGDGGRLIYLQRGSTLSAGRPASVSLDGRIRSTVDLAVTDILAGPRS